MAEPAVPILGSTLLAAALTRSSSKLFPASTGCTTIDAALHGGFRYREITSIAGASGMGKTLVSLHAIASHLTAHSNGEVAIIDTTGSFSPLRLRDTIVHRLSTAASKTNYQQSGYVYERAPPKAESESLESLQGKATVMLDRVKVMRVFDLAGVIEAISEARELCEGYERSYTGQGPERATTGVQQPEEVANSEDEDEEVSFSEDVHDLGREKKPALPHGGLGMTVIDNITNVVSATMSKNKTEAFALLTHALRLLQHLTATHNLCTLVLNSTVSATPSGNRSFYGRSNYASDNVSIFASTSGKPALGRSYAYLVDTSIFLSSIPTRTEDAEKAFGGRSEKWESVGILEVMKDRHGEREGEWGAFEMGIGGELRGPGEM
ncbi:hypothetical protein MMC13_003610 [Lambiella insularis]|nr:hypothetical protein [Lambiella insularis]